MLKCSKCKIAKPETSFNKCRNAKTGRKSRCRECQKQDAKLYCETHQDVIKQYRETNKTTRIDYDKQYKQKYYAANRDKILASTKAYSSARKKNDLNYKIAANLRTRIYLAIKHNYKTGSAINDLGCSIEYFINEYIPLLFLPNMSWNNYGKWHLDHIKPLASFDLQDRQQFLAACNYTNYQPLWAIDNFQKGAKLL